MRLQRRWELARLASLRVEDLTAVIDAQTRELKAANEALKREAALREDALRRLGESNEQIRALAYQDGLTGLPNRRLFNEHLEKVLARVAPQGHRVRRAVHRHRQLQAHQRHGRPPGRRRGAAQARRIAERADSHRRRARPVPRRRGRHRRRRSRSSRSATPCCRGSAATSSSSCCPTRAIDSRPARSRAGSWRTSSSRSASTATRCS